MRCQRWNQRFGSVTGWPAPIYSPFKGGNCLPHSGQHQQLARRTGILQCLICRATVTLLESAPARPATPAVSHHLLPRGPTAALIWRESLLLLCWFGSCGSPNYVFGYRRYHDQGFTWANLAPRDAPLGSLALRLKINTSRSRAQHAVYAVAHLTYETQIQQS